MDDDGHTDPARRLVLIGIGAGDPRLVTLEAVEALGSADVFFVFDKGDELADLRSLRDQILAAHARPGHRVVTVADLPRNTRDGGDYREAVSVWHAERASRLRVAIDENLGPAGVGALLVWGDPSLYDNTLRVVQDALAGLDDGAEITVIPGISSLHLLTARHRIPLNRVGASVRITTGRRLAEAPPDPDCDVVAFVDAACAFTDLDGTNVDIYWGGYLGSPDEMLIAGPLSEVGDEIVRRRAEARARKGWMFDCYLLRWRD